jgi:hypothetical protein
MRRWLTCLMLVAWVPTCAGSTSSWSGIAAGANPDAAQVVCPA